VDSLVASLFATSSERPLGAYREELPLRAYAMLDNAESQSSHSAGGVLMVQAGRGSPAKLAYERVPSSLAAAWPSFDAFSARMPVAATLA